jgi:hypothetical protein
VNSLLRSKDFFGRERYNAMGIFKRASLFILLACAIAIEGFVSSPLTMGTSFPLALPGSTSIRSGWSRPTAFDRVYATATEEAKSEVIGKEEAWLKPALHNTPAFRAVSILSALGLAWYSTTTASNPLAAMSTKAAATIHLLAYGTWLGSVFYTTFIAGFTLFKNLPRQTFGKVQAKLFPKYFNLGALTILLQVSYDLVTNKQHTFIDLLNVRLIEKIQTF